MVKLKYYYWIACPPHSVSWGAANAQSHSGDFFVSCDPHMDKTVLAEELSAVPLELVWRSMCRG